MPLKPEWKVNIPGLFKEILNNGQCAILRVPLQVTADILAKVAKRAIELDDPELNALMCRLALYEQSDPYSKSYDRKLMDRVRRMALKEAKRRATWRKGPNPVVDTK